MKQSIIAAGLILILLLTACGGAAGTESTATPSSGLNQSYSDALPVVDQLALGSLRLEETEQAIDESQAATLLPLWQAYQTLSTSDKAAEAEITALVKQLQQAMSSAQIDAIAAMKLTADDLTASTEELGGLFGRGAAREGDSEDASGLPFGQGGGFGGGMPPEAGFVGGMGGGGGLGGGAGQGEVDPAARATRVAEMQSGDSDLAGTFLSNAVVNALIRTLRVKTGEEIEVPQGTGRMDQAFWNSISEAAGIPLETLQAALAEGTTLAEAITAGGGDLEAVRDTLREAYADSNAAQGDLEAWIENLLNNPMPQFGRPAEAESGTPEP